MLDAQGRAEAAELRGTLPKHARYLTAPALPAFQTASLAGAAPLVTVAELADADYGRWAGRSAEDVLADEPEAFAAWRADLGAAPHGGESLAAVAARVGAWLDAQAGADGDVVAFVSALVVRAAVVHALGAPPAALWRVDVAPCSLTRLHHRDGAWRVVAVNARAAKS